MTNYTELYNQSTGYIRKKIGITPDVAIVAGSGIFDSFSFDNIIMRIKYEDIPELSNTAVAGHNNELILAEKYEKKCLVFSGRRHLYEGCDYHEVVSSAIISKKLGINKFSLTNAAGGLNLLFPIGSIMLIEDMINFSFRKIHNEIRFPEENIANKQIDIVAGDWLQRIKIVMQYFGNSYNSGVYASVLGPNYETPAEIYMYSRFADAIGMSTYHEAACAKILGLNVAACSLISNQLTPSNPSKLTHKEVLETSRLGSTSIAAFIDASIQTS
jgi:purine-nucleoside phosphorylase